MSTKSYSVSMSHGETAIWHTQRDEEYVRKEQAKGRLQNVDITKTKDNVFLKRCDSLEDEFNELFKDEVDDYNKKQKRDSRKIQNYYQHIKQNEKKSNKKNVMKTDYEYVIQFGSQYGSPKEAVEMLTKVYEELNDPDVVKYFHINYAVIHIDETTPHLHIDITPTAYGYTSSVSKRPALNRASQQCFKSPSRNYAYSDLLSHTKFTVMRKLLLDYGYQFNEEKSTGKKHLNVDEYKLRCNIDAMYEKEENLKEEIKATEESLEALSNEYNDLAEEYDDIDFKLSKKKNKKEIIQQMESQLTEMEKHNKQIEDIVVACRALQEPEDDDFYRWAKGKHLEDGRLVTQAFNDERASQLNEKLKEAKKLSTEEMIANYRKEIEEMKFGDTPNRDLDDFSF